MVRDKIIEHLISTKREGIGSLIEYMDNNGFFRAPCSTQHHLCKRGGLAEHSLNVMETMLKIASALGLSLEYQDSIIITGLLHDVGKAGFNGIPNYISNVLKKGEISKTKPYEVNKELLGLPHEVLSVSIITKFIDLSVEEYQAILYHNGLYTPLGNAIKGKETPLYLLLHMSDMWASRVIERGTPGLLEG